MEPVCDEYKQFSERAGTPTKTTPCQHVLGDLMWFVLPLLKFPFLLWIFTSGKVTLPVLQDPTTLAILVAAIIFFHALWLVLFLASIEWGRRAAR